ncbi:uncharacterized protein [Coffea arabica]|nr:BAG family molecular chaperone regulator 6-like [Coffea arabica]
MYSDYPFMDCYPHQTNQMPSPPHHSHHHHPRFEPIPGHMKADFEICPPHYQSWLSGGNYAYPYPAQCHSCCDHNYFPAYCALRPPYAHAPPLYCHGNYTIPPASYPAHYIPPPNNTMEPPRYKYHSEMHGESRCCGCPNHTHNSTPGKNVKIEEEDPDIEKKANNAVVPFDLKSYPYPVMWIPPSYMMNEAINKANEAQPEVKEKYSGVARADESSKPSGQQQKWLNGWFPFDMENSNLAKQGNDSTWKQQHQDESKRQLSFPLFWMPWSPEEMKKKDSGKTNFGEESAEGVSPQLEVTPVMIPDADEKASKPDVTKEIHNRECSKAPEKNGGQKTVPVKSAEPTKEKKNLENNKEKVKSSLAKNLNVIDERISSQTSPTSQSSSPMKSSKLPPICLRVDPLRKKNKNNGGSGSPSPPGDEGKLRKLSKDSSQLPSSSTTKESTEKDMTVGKSMPETAKNLEQSKQRVKMIEVTDRQNRQEPAEYLSISGPHGRSLSANSHDAELVHQTNDNSEELFPDVAASEVDLKSSAESKNDRGAVQVKSFDSICQSDEDKENSKVHESSADEPKGFAKIRLSEVEAALIIQSAYRGYEVRRREPLKKLKQIANIKEEVFTLNNRIKALESCSDTGENDKLRTMLGETIMNLLLKLDAIQGLHPSIRDVRKSVVRELVSLQEKLDHVSLERSESAHKLSSSAQPYEDMQLIDNRCFQEGEEAEKAFLESSLSKAEDVHEIYPEELCKGVAPPVLDIASDTRNLEIPETVMNKEDLNNGAQVPITDLLKIDTTQKSEAGCLPDNRARDDSLNLVCNDGERRSSEFQPQPFSEEVNHPWVGGGGAFVTDEVPNIKQLAELPKGVLESDSKSQDDSLLLSEAVDDKALQDGEVMEDNLRVKELTELPQAVPDDDVDKSRKHVILDKEDDKFVKDDVTRDINAEVPDDEVLNMDQAERWQQPVVKKTVTSKSNVTLACHENLANNMELCKKVDLKSQEFSVQALEEDKGCVSELGDISEMHDQVVLEMDANVLGSYMNDLHICSAEVEREELTASTKPVEVYKAEEEVLQELATMETEAETENESSKENGVAENYYSSSCEAAIVVAQVCDAPKVFTKSWNDASTEQKLLDERIGMEASGLGTVDNKFFAQDCDSAALEQDLVDQMMSVPPDAKETEAGEVLPSSPTASQISLGSNASTEHDRKLVEENDKLREMMQKLIEAGQQQLTAISNLSGRVKDLEKKLSRKKKWKMRRHGTTRYTSGPSGPSCLKP